MLFLKDIFIYFFALFCSRASSVLRVGIYRKTLFPISAEIGDFEESQCRSHLLNNNYIPEQMPLIDKIMEFHSKHM